jgi:protease IV
MKFFRAALFVILLGGMASAQSYYYYQNEFAMTSPGAMRYGLYGAVNPALLTTLAGPDILFTWSDAGGWRSLERWGLFAAVANFSFIINRQNIMENSITDYKLNTAFGDKTMGLGFGYGWSNGDRQFFQRSKIFTAGTFIRPSIYFSAGVIGNFPSNGLNEGIIDFAVRPFGNELLSLFGDYLFKKNIPSEMMRWSAGAALEIIPGIRLAGRYFDKDYITAGVEFSLGNTGISSQARIKDDNYYNTYGIRIGSYDRNVFAHLRKEKTFSQMEMKGGLKYQRFRFFDNSNTLYNILDYIKIAREDETSAGVVLNLSGMVINREMTWEIRNELMELKKSGKRVYVYFDRLDINGYHLASAADKIIIDPLGSLVLQGYVMGRTYFTGTLDKIGIGFNEIRNFKYKSAYETYSRTEMSEADEEQYQALVDTYYELARNDISTSRGFTHSLFDSLVNNIPLYDADDAIRIGLADTSARWDKLNDIVNRYEDGNKNFVSPSSLPLYNNPDDNYWGEKPKIAVIYALGVCAMDEGINARELVKQLTAVLEDSRVKGVVLRVDSPGGDALASDLISEKIKEYKYRKPVIISQGFVAGSGGYWLSMYGDTIVAAPNTITGSIGVIGAWAYNKNLKEDLGIATDHVKRGRHADLGFGMSLPLIGMSLPDRNLTDAEEEKFRDYINVSYRMFVNKVSEGRKTEYDKIHELAQGRVWSGRDGKANGLIDVLGNLNTAIDIAVKKSGLEGKEYEVIQLPEPGMFDFNIFVPRLMGLNLNIEDPAIQYLKFRLENTGKPMPVLPLELNIY